MGLWRVIFGTRAAPALIGQKIALRAPQAEDFAEWSTLRRVSRDDLQPFEPTWGHDELSASAYRRRLGRYQREAQGDQGYVFYLFRLEDGAMVGGMTLGTVRRGVIQSAMLGYWMGTPFAGRGYMSEALGLLVSHAFEGLRLHRVEAACLTDNAASMRVLEKAGFQREGLARSYLKIDGHWQDHYLYACVNRADTDRGRTGDGPRDGV